MALGLMVTSCQAAPPQQPDAKVEHRPGPASVNGVYAYVGNAHNDGHGSISVVDTTANDIVATIELSSPPNAITATPDGNYLYVATEQSPGLWIIDRSSNAVTATVNVGNDARGVALTPDGGFAYVTVGDANHANVRGQVAVVETASDTVVNRIDVGGSPKGIVLSPDGDRAFVTINQDIRVIDTATNAADTSIPVTILTGTIRMAPDDHRLYVATFQELTVFDTETNQVTTGTMFGFTSGFALSPDGSTAYVSSSCTTCPGFVTIVDTDTLEETARIEATHFTGQLDITPDGATVYVGDRNGGVTIFDTQSAKVSGSLPPPQGAHTSAVTIVGNA